MRTKYWVSEKNIRDLKRHNIKYEILGHDLAATPQIYRITIEPNQVDMALNILKGEEEWKSGRL